MKKNGKEFFNRWIKFIDDETTVEENGYNIIHNQRQRERRRYVNNRKDAVLIAL